MKNMDKKILATALLVLMLSGLAFAGDLKATNASYDPAPAAPGSIITVWVQVQNDSFYDAENAIVKLDVGFPFTLQPGQKAERNLGSIRAYKTITVEYKLLVDDKATDGDHSITVAVGEEITIRESDFVITVLSRTPKLEIVESSTDFLSPGSVEPVIITVKNIGGSIAKDIVMKVNPDRTVTSTGVVVEREIVSLGAVSNYVGSLDMGQSANVELTLAVNQDTALKNYSIPVTIEYFDQNGTEKSETAYLGIKVSAKAEVDTVVDSVTPKAYPGGTSEITVDLFNVGLADASYVVVELSGEGVSIAEPRQFVGTLEADDFDSFKTELTIDPTTPLGSMPLTLKIIYKDDTLQEKVETKTLVIQVSDPIAAAGGIDPVGIVIGLIGLALQLVGLWVAAKWAWPKIKAFRNRK